MKAKVTAIESGGSFLDGERRISLRIEEADSMYRTIRVRESLLTFPVQLDDEVVITFANLSQVMMNTLARGAVR